MKTAKGKSNQSLPIKERLSIKQLWIIAGILLVTFLIYLPVFQNTFLNWDDNRYITNNPFIKHLNWEQVKGYFTMFFDGHYHPLTMLSLAIDYEIGGLSPNVFQTTSLAIHLVNSILVFYIVQKLFKNRTITIIAASLFAIHPIQVESVAWMSERKNVLFAAFFLGSLLVYLKYLEQQKWNYYILTFVLFVFACFSKVTAITLTAILILVDIYYDRSYRRFGTIFEKLPFLFLSIVLLYFGSHAQDVAWTNPDKYTFFERIPFASYAFVQYLIKLIVPFNLSGIYPYPASGNLYWIFLPVAIALGVLVLYFYNRSRLIFFGLAFFVINIITLLKLFRYPYGNYIMADRYDYLPAIGVFIVIGFIATWLLQRYPAYKIGIYFTVGLYLFVLGVSTNNRVKVWRDDLTFFEDIVAKYPNTVVAWNNLGNAKLKIGNTQSALQCFSRAYELDSTDLSSLGNRAALKAQLNDYKGAIQDFDKIIAKNPSDSILYYNRALAKASIKDWLGAITDYSLALNQRPQFTEGYCNRGVAYANIGNYQNAIDDFSEAIRLNPNYSIAFFNRGKCYALQNNLQYAGSDFSTAIGLNPRYISAYLSRAKVYLSMHKPDLAIIDLRQVLAIDPQNSAALGLINRIN